MSLDSQIITLVVDNPENFSQLQRLGVGAEDFEEEWGRVWNYLLRTRRQTKTIPSRDVIERRFSDVTWARRVRRSDLPILVAELKERRRYNRFLELLQAAARECEEPDQLTEVLSMLQGDLNALSMKNGSNPIMDVTSRAFRRHLFSEIRSHRNLEAQGVMTGFPTLDALTGGLQPGRMIVVIGRAGSYKSWMNLFFVAEAVMQGKKVILYSLEMTLYETIMRLYTIFSQKIFNPSRALKNFDLSRGRISRIRLERLLDILENDYRGRLLVADISKMEGPYTIDRIEAEIEIYQPHMFWIDYLTLMQPTSSNRNVADWQNVRTLSSGVKGISLRQHVIGGASAQVNREFMKTRAKLPRLEHISFGDSLAADADQVISLAKVNANTIMYALIKNRHGPEGFPITCKTNVNVGEIVEVSREDDDEEEA